MLILHFQFDFFFELYTMKLLHIVCGITCVWLVMSSCRQAHKNSNTVLKKDSERITIVRKNPMLQTSKKPLSKHIKTASNLRDVQTFNPHIFVDIKYATKDNFMHQVLYTTIKKAYLQKDVALRLARCQEYLSAMDSSLHLLIYDAVRPVSVQWKMWKALDTLSVTKRTKFVSNPVNKSLHNYGAAVDLTICRSDKTPLDMGAGFDDVRPIAYPILEDKFLANGMLTLEQVTNRKLLRKVMLSQAFHVLPTEWWHFNACSRPTARKKYALLKNEW